MGISLAFQLVPATPGGVVGHRAAMPAVWVPCWALFGVPGRPVGSPVPLAKFQPCTSSDEAVAVVVEAVAGVSPGFVHTLPTRSACCHCGAAVHDGDDDRPLLALGGVPALREAHARERLALVAIIRVVRDGRQRVDPVRLGVLDPGKAPERGGDGLGSRPPGVVHQVDPLEARSVPACGAAARWKDRRPIGHPVGGERGVHARPGRSSACRPARAGQR